MEMMMRERGSNVRAPYVNKRSERRKIQMTARHVLANTHTEKEVTVCSFLLMPISHIDSPAEGNAVASTEFESLRRRRRM